ncbi:MAG: polyamine ABC transporter substrate-binding protein [Rhodospirillaceae bacterium]|nr:polyamine ABC transporter substrate-binding protein [Rhodospirillaceae bacterium]MCA8931599.1 polyamine ABC transporter substrate-binding protein [Rhodospirillaceae bacterium]
MIKQALLCTCALAAIGGTAAAQDVVRVFNWSDYIDEDILTSFTEDTGIEVIYDVFDSNEVLETRLLAGNTGYDVVVPTASFMARQIEAGVFQPMERSLIPNAQYAWPEIDERVSRYDPGNVYGINYMWGTTGIGFVQELLDERMENAPVDSWSIVFDPEIASRFADCGIYWLDAPTEIFPSVLVYLGYDPNSTNPEELEAAAAAMEAVRPYIRRFHSSEYISALANGDICLAIGWSGDVLQARDRAAEAENGLTIDYRIPSEGAQMWFDMFAIPADAPDPDAARAFINYVMDPEVNAQAINYINYASGNVGAQEFVDPEVLADPAIFPNAETLANLFTVDPYDPQVQRLVNRLWTRVKSGQ